MPLPVPPHVVWLRRGVLVLLAASFAVLVWRHAVAPLPPIPGMPPPTVETAQAVAARLAAMSVASSPAHPPAPVDPDPAEQPRATAAMLVDAAEIGDADRWYAPKERPIDQEPNHGRLVCAHARLDRHRIAMPGGLVADHWSRMFETRTYDRTFCYGTTLLPGGAPGPVGLVFAAPAPAAGDRDVLVFGRADVDLRFVYEEVWIEVLAWAPLRPDGTADLDRLAVTTSPGHAALAAALRR
jgi:hypothetical protein